MVLGIRWPDFCLDSNHLKVFRDDFIQVKFIEFDGQKVAAEISSIFFCPLVLSIAGISSLQNRLCQIALFHKRVFQTYGSSIMIEIWLPYDDRALLLPQSTLASHSLKLKIKKSAAYRELSHLCIIPVKTTASWNFLVCACFFNLHPNKDHLQPRSTCNFWLTLRTSEGPHNSLNILS